MTSTRHLDKARAAWGDRLPGWIEGLALESSPMGLFGKVVANPAGQVLKAGERVEIYRPLKADPKLNRKKRAQEKAAKP